jgi:hypothetical protein
MKEKTKEKEEHKQDGHQISPNIKIGRKVWQNDFLYRLKKCSNSKPYDHTTTTKLNQERQRSLNLTIK